jgi:hypothetical protein
MLNAIKVLRISNIISLRPGTDLISRDHKVVWDL